MKKEITEYEGAEDTITKIKCGSCEETWDNRKIRGIHGVNTVVLDATVERKRHRGWKQEGERKWNGTSIISSYPVRMSGEEVEDYCNGCWETFFTTGPAVEVEEPEYYVEEQTREEYYCDFCGDEMGEESDHIVTLNPRIVVKKKVRKGYGFSERRETTTTRQIEDTVSCNSHDRLYAKRDDSFDCCSQCADRIFNRSRTMMNSGNGLNSAIINKIKGILLLKGV